MALDLALVISLSVGEGCIKQAAWWWVMTKEMGTPVFSTIELKGSHHVCWAKFMFGVIRLKEFDIIRLKESQMGMSACHPLQR